MNVASRMLLEKVEAACSEVAETGQTPVTAQVENPPYQLNEDGERLRKTYTDAVDSLHHHSLQRIANARHALDMAEQALEHKRKAMLDAVQGLVLTVQEVELQTTEMQRAMGNLHLAIDQT